MLFRSLTRGREDWKALARAHGTSRRASGWADEKVARSGRLSSPPSQRAGGIRALKASLATSLGEDAGQKDQRNSGWHD